MPPLRRLIGALALIGFMAIYALIAMVFAQARFILEAPPWLQPIYYSILGLAWVAPMMPLVKWMLGPHKPRPR